MRVDDGDVVHAWALAGLGIMLKSEVDVAEDLAAGRLERVLPDWDGGNAPIVALYPSAQYLPLKTRVLLDQLAAHVATVMTGGPNAYPSQAYRRTNDRFPCSFTQKRPFRYRPMLSKKALMSGAFGRPLVLRVSSGVLRLA